MSVASGSGGDSTTATPRSRRADRLGRSRGAEVRGPLHVPRVECEAISALVLLLLLLLGVALEGSSIRSGDDGVSIAAHDDIAVGSRDPEFAGEAVGVPASA